jgi:hypothetical protein
LQADPYELEPLDLVENSVLADRLNGILLVSKTCEQNSCRNPYSALHPDGSVKNLQDALDPKYDDYYSSLPEVAFGDCLPNLVAVNEEPFFPSFNASSGFGKKWRDVSADSAGNEDLTSRTVEEAKFGFQFLGPAAIERSAMLLKDEFLYPWVDTEGFSYRN